MFQALPKYLIRNWSFSIDGISQIGQASEFGIPEIKFKTEDIRNAGMIMPIKARMGIEPLVGKMKIMAFDPGTLSLFGVQIGKANTFLGACYAVDEDGGGEHQGVFTAKGYITQLKVESWQADGKKHETEYEMNYSYCKLEIDSKPVFEITPYDIIIRGNSMYPGQATALMIT